MLPVRRGRIVDRSAGTPVLVIRGALSDILGAGMVGTMQHGKPDLHAEEGPDGGIHPSRMNRSPRRP